MIITDIVGIVGMSARGLWVEIQPWSDVTNIYLQQAFKIP